MILSLTVITASAETALANRFVPWSELTIDRSTPYTTIHAPKLTPNIRPVPTPHGETRSASLPDLRGLRSAADRDRTRPGSTREEKKSTSQKSAPQIQKSARLIVAEQILTQLDKLKAGFTRRLEERNRTAQTPVVTSHSKVTHKIWTSTKKGRRYGYGIVTLKTSGVTLKTSGRHRGKRRTHSFGSSGVRR
jgi:hypothetical protein